MKEIKCLRQVFDSVPATSFNSKPGSAGWSAQACVLQKILGTKKFSPMACGRKAFVRLFLTSPRHLIDGVTISVSIVRADSAALVQENFENSIVLKG